MKKLLALIFLFEASAFAGSVNVTQGSSGGSITIQAPATSGGGGGGSALEVFSNFDSVKSSPTASIALGDAMKLTVTGSTAVITVDQSSVTLQGTLVAGSGVTLTPSGGQTTIASTGGGTTIYKATNTAFFPFGLNASTGIFTSGITAPYANFSGSVANPSANSPIGTTVTGTNPTASAGMWITNSDAAGAGTNTAATCYSGQAGVFGCIGMEQGGRLQVYDNLGVAHFTINADTNGWAFLNSGNSHIQFANDSTQEIWYDFGARNITSWMPIVVRSSFTVTSTAVFNGAMAVSNGVGTNGQILTSAGNGTPPSWTTISSGGSAIRPSSFTYTFNAEQAGLGKYGLTPPVISNSTNEAMGSLLFDETSTMTVVWSTVLKSYQGGQLTVDFLYTSTATTGTVNFGAYIQCDSMTTAALDTASFGSINSTSTVTNATTGALTIATIALTNGDSCANGNTATLKVERSAGLLDTMVGYAKLRKMSFYER